jgi:hypothetical protein
MSDTPETDAETALMTLDCDYSCVEIYLKRDGKTVEGDFVLAKFARQLERERDESRKLLREANRGAERNAHVNRLLAQHLNESAQKFQTADAELSISNGERDAFRRENAEMREVIKDAYSALDDCVTRLVGWHGLYEGQLGKEDHDAFTNGDKALTKLQSFLKP